MLRGSPLEPTVRTSACSAYLAVGYLQFEPGRSDLQASSCARGREQPGRSSEQRVLDRLRTFSTRDRPIRRAPCSLPRFPAIEPVSKKLDIRAYSVDHLDPTTAREPSQTIDPPNVGLRSVRSTELAIVSLHPARVSSQWLDLL